MKKLLSIVLLSVGVSGAASAYQLQSNKELGTGDAKNQNVVVACTTTTGKVSTQTCALRRYAKCADTESGGRNCAGWGPWKDVRDPDSEHGDWRGAATACCQAKGLR
jgi:hypothetical protein